MSSGRSDSCAVHPVMDLITVMVFAYLVLTVNNASAWLRPYNLDTRLVRKTLRYSRRPSIWRVVPLGMEKKKILQPSASETDAKFSPPDKGNKIEDQESSGSEHGQYLLLPSNGLLKNCFAGHSHGRVRIKVFRGPEDAHNHFARHGFFVKHPEDD